MLGAVNMVDFTDSKIASQGTYPVEVKETSGLTTRIETLITPEHLKSRYLKGVDVSDYTVDELKDEIMLAINEFELMSGLTVNPVQHSEVLPFDASFYRSFVYTKTNHGPILSVQSFTIESSDEKVIYPLPTIWLDMRLAHRRQINIIPLLTANTISTANVGLVGGGAGAFLFLRALGNINWMPAFWKITYTAGICKEEGKLPVIVNDVIGLTAAIEILSAKQNQIVHTSQSLSQDSISQSSGGAGTQTYQPRIAMLEAKRDKLLKKIKGIFFSKYYMSNM